MKALIYKDLATLKKTLIPCIIISFVAISYGIYSNAFLITPMLCVMLPLVLNSSSFAYDAAAKFESLAFSMPIARKDYVFSKLFFPAVFGIFGSLFIFVTLYIQNKFTIPNIIIIPLIVLAMAILIPSIQLPFLIKFGAEKGRIIMVITYALVFAGSSVLKEYIPGISRFFSEISRGSLLKLTLIVLGISVLLIGPTVFISIKIINKKEY